MFGRYSFADFAFTDLVDRDTHVLFYGPATLKADFTYVIYAATREFATLPTDAPPNTPFSGTLEQPLSFRRSILGGNEIGVFTVGDGVMEISNTDAFYDFLINQYAVDGRSVIVKYGELGAPYNTFLTVFSGTAADWTIDESGVHIILRDNSYKLTVPAQSNVYGGTGGADGGADLTGKRKPRAFGYVQNVEPPLSDPSLLIYQVNDGAIQAVTAVYDRGSALTPGADFATYALLTAASPGAGTYITCLALGFIRLGSSPVGTVTADISGASGVVDNLLLYSQQLSHSPWIVSGLSVADNTVTDPLGGNTATTVTVLSGFAALIQNISLAVGSTYTHTFSIYLKAGTISAVRLLPLWYNSVTSAQEAVVVDVNLTTGVITNQGAASVILGAYLGATIQAVGNGWYRVSVSGRTAETTLNNIEVLVLDLSGGAGTFYAWGAQLQSGASLTAYRVTTNGYTYSTGSIVRGILTSPIVTYSTANLLLRSQEFANATVWAPFNATVTDNSAVDPLGGSTASTVTMLAPSGGLNQGLLNQNTAQPYTTSIYVKAGSSNIIRLILYWFNALGGLQYMLVDSTLSTGTINSAVGGSAGNGVAIFYGAAIRDAGGGWYRISVSGQTTDPTAVTVTYQVVSLDTSGNYFVWGGQLEPGITLTDYVATTTTAGLRAKTIALLSDPADLYIPSFSAIETIQPADIGYWMGPDDTTTVSDVIAHLMHGVGGWGGYRRDGRFEVNIFLKPAGTPTDLYDETDIIDIKREPLPGALTPQPWRQRVAYQRAWTTQTDLAGGVSATRKSFVAEPYRLATASDNSIITNHPFAQDPDPIQAYFKNQADAQIEANRRMALYNGAAALYRLQVPAQRALRRNLGEVISVTFPRWDLPTGRLLTVVEMSENAQGNTFEVVAYG
jgi:hypothetical protein